MGREGKMNLEGCDVGSPVMSTCFGKMLEASMLGQGRE